MKKLGMLLVASLLAVSAGACQRQDEQTQKKLDLLITKVEGLEKKVAAGPVGRAAAAGMPGQPGAQQPRRGPDPAVVYAVDIAGDPFIGPADAKVTIVKASEYACPFCQRVEPTLEQLVKDYGKDIRIVYKNYVVHPDRASAAAWAVCAAHEQGKFVEYNKILWEKGFPQKLAEADMHGFAEELKLNVPKFKADMASDKCKQEVANDQKILSAVGTSGTPAFYINGRFLSGARPIEQFKAVIDEELKKANDAIGKGEAAASYYQKNVVEKGKKAI